MNPSDVPKAGATPGEADVIAWLCARVDGPDDHVAYEALRSIRESATDEPTQRDLARRAVVHALERPLLTKTAARTLGIFGDCRDVPALRLLLDHEDGRMRAAAAEALGNFVCSDAVAALRRALGDLDADVRRHAVVSLGRLGDATAAP